MYDLVSGRQLLKSSYVVGKKKALELFPMLKKDKLCGAIIYYDGEPNLCYFSHLTVETLSKIIKNILSYITGQCITSVSAT